MVTVAATKAHPLDGADPSANSYGGRVGRARLYERRRLLIEAALDVFSARSGIPPTIVEVCRIAHVSSRQFYDLFDSRESLLMEIYNTTQDSARLAVRSALGTNPHEPFKARWRRAAQALVDDLAADPRRIKVTFGSLVDLSPQSEKHLHDQHKNWTDLVMGEIKIATTQGVVISRTKNYDLAITSLFGSIRAVMLAYTQGPKNNLQDVSEEIIRLVTGSLSI
ncbi:MAG: TetR/AcrR family transcriptional regulator [Mycobacteriaceae bacterium]